MRVSMISFTEDGEDLEERIRLLLEGRDFRREAAIEQASPEEAKISVVCLRDSSEIEEAYASSDAIIFISALGIAMRLIGPLLHDKLSDPAILCIDEMGQFVIPLASGHVGGANQLSRLLADKLDAIPVITTATDLHGAFAIDEFAAENGLTILHRDRIKRVNKKLLLNEPVNLAIEDDVVITSRESEVLENELGLLFRPVVVGMGLRRGKPFIELERYFLDTLEALHVDKERLLAIATIDVKKDEIGLHMLCEKYNLPLVTYSAEELRAVEGDFEASEFVEATVGVSDVSARAAKALGERGHFLLKKDKRDGMTISVFEKYRRITISHE